MLATRSRSVLSYPLDPEGRDGLFDLGEWVSEGHVHPARRYVMVSQRQDASLLHDQADHTTFFSDHETVSRPSPVAQYLNEEFEKLAARRDNVQMPSDTVFTGAVLIRLYRALMHVCDENTVYPHVAPDGEGGVVATWFAGDLMIEIACDSQLRLEFVKQDGEDGLRRAINLGSAASLAASLRDVRNELRKLTELVNTRNPSWRKLFPR